MIKVKSPRKALHMLSDHSYTNNNQETLFARLLETMTKILRIESMLLLHHIIAGGRQAVSFIVTWEGLCLTLIGVAALLLRIRYRKQLRDIPGPFWASILPFNRLITSASGQQQ
jgi:hypothetical protein